MRLKALAEIYTIYLLAEAESGRGVETGGMAKEHHGYLQKFWQNFEKKMRLQSCAKECIV